MSRSPHRFGIVRFADLLRRIPFVQGTLVVAHYEHELGLDAYDANADYLLDALLDERLPKFFHRLGPSLD